VIRFTLRYEILPANRPEVARRREKFALLIHAARRPAAGSRNNNR
jgi:hypothetical protein